MSVLQLTLVAGSQTCSQKGWGSSSRADPGMCRKLDFSLCLPCKVKRNLMVKVLSSTFPLFLKEKNLSYRFCVWSCVEVWNAIKHIFTVQWRHLMVSFQSTSLIPMLISCYSSKSNESVSFEQNRLFSHSPPHASLHLAPFSFSLCCSPDISNVFWQTPTPAIRTVADEWDTFLSSKT